MKPLSEKRDRRRHQRRSVREFLMILFWGACSGPFLIRSLSAADSGSAVRKHLSISGGDFFTTNYYLEMRENGDLIYRTTNDTTFKDFWATVVTLIDRYFPSGTD